MKRKFHSWFSDHVKREMGLLVLGHAGAKVLVFPTRDGNALEYERLRMPLWLEDKLEAGQLQLFCVDNLVADSLYAFWMRPEDRIKRHIEYEHFVVDEVIPFMDEVNDHECRISHGLSLGAYQATNLAFRHPHLFQKLCAFSGRYDLTLTVEYFGDLFDGFYSEDIYYHNPSHYLPNLEDESILTHLRAMDMVFTIGVEDPFLENNRALSQMLWDKGIWHAMHEWHGRAHEGYSWRRMGPLYL